MKKIDAFLLLMGLLICFSGCVPKAPRQQQRASAGASAGAAGEGEAEGAEAEAAEAGMIADEEQGFFPHAPQAIIIAGKQPLWFEFAPRFPKHLARIEDAALSDFSPWPDACYATGLLPFQNGDALSLAVAVNHFGFLAILPSSKAGGLLFYTFEETEFFPRYTASVPFYFDGNPAVLLSVNDFFSDTTRPPPSRRCFMLSAGERALLSPEIPAFKTFPPEELWDVDSIFPGGEGLWYFRARKKTKDKKTLFYGRTEASGASHKIEEIEEALYYESIHPARAAACPPLIAALIQKAAELRPALTGDWILYVYVKDIGKLTYSAKIQAGGKNGDIPEKPPLELFALYAGENNPASACLLVSEAAGSSAAVLSFRDSGAIVSQTLPLLPEAFFWTGAGIVDFENGVSSKGSVIAFWEERDGWNIGAAGFVIIELER